MVEFKSNSSIMIGGFGGSGIPSTLVKMLIISKAINLTIISNDTGGDQNNVLEQLLLSGKVSKFIGSYIGYSRYDFIDIDIELIPQGLFVEKIRAMSSGIDGIVLDGQVHLPMVADIGLIYANKIDKYGNLKFNKVIENFNKIMAMAAQYTIVEFQKLEPLDSNDIDLPFCFVNEYYKTKNSDGSR